MVTGPAELAVLGHADVLPFTSSCQKGQSLAQFEQPIRAATVAETAQKLCDIGSNYIYKNPEQWQHWFHVPEMLGETQ
jgi:lauroyl/myristoyl acyltransferase